LRLGRESALNVKLIFSNVPDELLNWLVDAFRGTESPKLARGNLQLPRYSKNCNLFEIEVRKGKL